MTMTSPKIVEVKPISQTVSELEDVCVMSGALYLIFRIGQVLGLAPVRFQRLNEGWRVRFSPILSYLGYVFLALTTALLLIFLALSDPMGKMRTLYRSHIGYFTWALNYIIVMISSSIVGVTASKRTKGILNCLHKIQKIKATLKIESDNLKKYKIVSVLWFLYTFASFAVDYYNCWTDEQGHLNTTFLHLVSYVQVFAVLLSIQQFIFVVLEINSVLRATNDLLETLLYGKKEVSQIKGLLGQETESVDQIVHHLSLKCSGICDLVRELNEATGCSNMAVLVTCFLALITTPYALIASFIHAVLSPTHVIATANWIMNYVLWMVAIIEPCHRTNVEMSRTNCLVSKLAMKYTDRLSGEELDKFHQYLLLYKVSFSPMEICTLDRPLIATITASVTTYLVILIQFQTLDGNQI